MLVDGPAGALETLLDGDGSDLAVLCHPHPQYGGTMHDAVLDCAARALGAAGIARLRFNFRGVGRSEGRFDEGVGEVDDVLAILTHGRKTHPEARVLLVGYSFGAAMALSAASRAPGLSGLLLIAPPAGHMTLADAEPNCPVHIIAGREDACAPLTALETLTAALATAASPVILNDADHFFIGAQPSLEKAVAQVIPTLLP